MTDFPPLGFGAPDYEPVYCRCFRCRHPHLRNIYYFWKKVVFKFMWKYVRRAQCLKRGHSFYPGPPMSWMTWCRNCGQCYD